MSRAPRRIERVHPRDPDAAALVERYLAELDARLGGFDPARSVSAGSEEMSPPRGAFLVAYVEDRAVGCGGLKQIDLVTAEIKRMYVPPEARRQGHARALLAALEDAARALGAREVVLDTAAPLAEAAALYEGAGYVATAPYNDNRYAARWYRKPLR